MQREFLRNLGLDDTVIESIMAENGRDIAAEQAKIPTDYDQIKKERDELAVQISQFNGQGNPLYAANTQGNTSKSDPDDDPAQAALKEALDLKAKYQRDLVSLKVKEVFVDAGFSEEDYASLLDSVVTEDEDVSLERAKALVGLVSAKVDATEKETRERLLTNTPAPANNNGDSQTDNSLAVKMAKKYGEKYFNTKE